MQFRSIEYASPEYEAACALRHTFLRVPLGLELTESDTSGEESQHHFGLYINEKASEERLIGSLIGKPLPQIDAQTVQVRQVVVHGDWRGKGAGRLLMDEAEKRLSELGFTRFVLYAREESASFYERCGYQRTGEALELIGFKHWRMEKQSYC